MDHRKLAKQICILIFKSFPEFVATRIVGELIFRVRIPDSQSSCKYRY